MYADFFDPPPGMSTKKSPVRPKAGKVRFHEEVKVKKIKAQGKGLPVNTPTYWTEEMDDDQEFIAVGDEDEMLNGHLDLDQDYEVDSEEDGDGDDHDHDDGEEEEEDSDVEDDQENHDEDDKEDDQEISDKGRQAVERLKDDLFAEQDSEVEPEEGGFDGSGLGCC